MKKLIIYILILLLVTCDFPTKIDNTSLFKLISTVQSNGTVATPTFNPPPGTYTSEQAITISTATSGASIYYTVDGSLPTTSSNRYTGSVLITGSTNTIQAIAVKSGMSDSSAASGTYIINYTAIITSPSIPYVSNNAGAVNSKSINWISTRNGTYSIRVGGTDCNTGSALTSGVVTMNANNNYTLNASSLALGANTIRFCITDSGSGFSGFNSIIITRDDTAPAVVASPGSSSSGTLLSIALSCTDTSSGCDKIAYTSNGTTPGITGSTGAITAGTQYSSQLSPSDNTTTTYKYIARDNAGNVSNVLTSAYTIDTTVASVTINSISPGSTVDAVTNFQINWQANEAGTYTIKVGGTSCTDGILATGANISGSNSANTAISTTINNSNLSTGSNTVRICIQNVVGNYGYNTQTIIKDDVAPVVGDSGTITNSNTYSTSLTLNWVKATDTYTSQASLQYKVVKSLLNNISTVSSAETNGTLIQDWATDINTLDVSGLSSGTLYYFNILVKDSVSNKAIYQVVTNPPTITYPGAPTIYTFLKGTSVNLTPTIVGPISNISVTPLLPPGLNINSGTGVISGIPTTSTATTTSYTITATNSGGNTTTSIIIHIDYCYAWGCFVDNGNGTIRFDGIAGTFGGVTYPAQTLTFMKCLQGEAWNSGTNSCDGTAGTYQYCSTNDDSCNNAITGELNGTGSSSAYSTCDTLTFAGHSDWRVPTKNEIKLLINCSDKSMITDSSWCQTIYNDRNPLMILFPNNYSAHLRYWTSSSYSSSNARELYGQFNGGAYFYYISNSMNTKVTYNRIRCVR